MATESTMDDTESAPARDPVQIVTEQIVEFRKATHTPQVSVALYCNGQGHTLGFPAGTVTPDLVFSLGSVGKVFTATILAYQCVAPAPPLRQKALTDPVSQYLPAGVATKGQAIKSVKLVDLATQTSCFPRDCTAMGTAGRFGPSLEQIHWWTTWTNEGTRQKGDACVGGTPGGNCWQYSNWGFVTLGYAVGQWDRDPIVRYTDLLQAYITGPLAMTHTSAEGPGGIKSSGGDMLRFMTASLTTPTNGVLTQLQLALKLTHEVHWKKEPDGLQMGLAWQMMPKAHPGLLVKNGATGNWTCFVGLVPRHQLGLTILTDMSGNNPTSVGLRILDEILGNLAGSLATAFRNLEVPEEVDDVGSV
jgi:beta-lactamase class C